MAAGAIGEERPALFLRKATGLVRGWSVRDSMIYACLATNVVTLGIYEFSFQSFIPKGQILTSVLISAVWVSFVVTLITIVLAGILVSIGMAGYARIQKWCFYGGLVGFAVIVVLLLFSSHANFISSFNREAQSIFGVSHAYQA